MTENKSDGWDTEHVYTVIQNVTKNSKIVLSNLNGIEVAPGQTLDLRTSFRKSQVQDAGHEIASLIRSGHLKDVGEGADQRVGVIPSGGAPTQAEMQKRMKDSMLREISDSTNLSFLEDQMKSKDTEVAQAARLRAEILLGMRDDQGKIIPGHENDEAAAKPTEFIRSPSTDPAIQQEAASGASGGVRRAQ